MFEREDIEKIRQEIMRFRELLTLMQGYQKSGEQSYAKLFARFSAEETAGIREKDLQWKAAEAMSPDDVAELGRAVGQMRFYARELERNFEDLHGTILAAQDSEGE